MAVKMSIVIFRIVKPCSLAYHLVSSVPEERIASIIYPEDGGDTLLRNVGDHLQSSGGTTQITIDIVD
jgi:hypothetical protein